ncbi:hypothetical protein ACOSP7_016966 [Xanthoceras sorbifolium]
MIGTMSMNIVYCLYQTSGARATTKRGAEGGKERCGCEERKKQRRGTEARRKKNRRGADCGGEERTKKRRRAAAMRGKEAVVTRREEAMAARGIFIFSFGG